MGVLRIMIDARMCQGRYDGVTRYVTRLIRELRAGAGMEVVALCADRVPDDLTAYDVETVVTDFNRSTRAALRRWWWEQRRLPSVIRAAGVDLYHATWNTGIPLRCPVPAVLTIHDLIPLACPADYFATPWQRWSYRVSLRTSVRRAERIVTVSDYVRKDCLCRLGIPPERITAIPNGVDALPVSAPDPELRDADYVLYVGGPEKRKNVAGMLAVMDHLWRQGGEAPDFWLTGALERQCPAARARYDALKHKERVRFLGSPGDEELGRVLASARALLMLSTAEGFGLPALEALARGCPAVVSNRASLPQVVGDAGLVVDLDDVPAVAARVLAVTRDDALRADLIERGRRRAATFSWAQTARQTAEVYRTVLAVRADGRRRRIQRGLRRSRAARRMVQRAGPDGTAEAV